MWIYCLVHFTSFPDFFLYLIFGTQQSYTDKTHFFRDEAKNAFFKKERRTKHVFNIFKKNALFPEHFVQLFMKSGTGFRNKPNSGCEPFKFFRAKSLFHVCVLKTQI